MRVMLAKEMFGSVLVFTTVARQSTITTFLPLLFLVYSSYHMSSKHMFFYLLSERDHATKQDIDIVTIQNNVKTDWKW